MPLTHSVQPLYITASFRGVEMVSADIDALQRLFDENPDYFMLVRGMPAGPDEGYQEFHDRPPLEVPYSRTYTIGFENASRKFIGMAGIATDLFAKHVWHIGLFLVATKLHGQGAARELLIGLEEWMKRGGAEWIRLNVLFANPRAERFWRREGYNEVCQRFDVDVGGAKHALRTMVKSTRDEPVAKYFEKVPRDRVVVPIAENDVESTALKSPAKPRSRSG